MFAFLPENNGRVNVAHATEKAFPMHTSAQHHTTDSHLSTIQMDSTLSRTFFSLENQQILQNAIRYQVWENTQKVIGTQDSLQLQIVMRSSFLQHARHSDSIPIKKQIKELNDWTLEYCVPKIISNVKQFMHYTKDLATLPVPADHAVNVSQKGSKTLSVHPFV
jgi:hypothetical protein